MRSLGAVLIALVLLPAPALAEHPAACRAAESQVVASFPLPRVAKALTDKRLDILVLGAGSSVLPGRDGAAKAYPVRLQAALTEKFPGVAVRVETDVRRGRTAADMTEKLGTVLAATKPALLIWQTGTVDAMRAVEPDKFAAALDSGVNAARSAKADVVFINAQYSPRTESIIALGNYLENMRWVALQQELLLFDRFGIMQLWSERNVFDFHAPTKKLDTAEQVHDCIGRLLADLIAEGVRLAAPPGGGR
ncbi:MAG: SGNH/GDSL hydrolase family protein [Rhizobiaceae bacterium]